MPEIRVQSLEQFKSLTATGLSVIKFTASWCGPCVRIAPVFTEFANKEYDPRCNWLIVDIDDAQGSDLNKVTNQVRSVPTFQFMKDGAVVDTLIGANVAKLTKMIGSFTIGDKAGKKIFERLARRIFVLLITFEAKFQYFWFIVVNLKDNKIANI